MLTASMVAEMPFFLYFYFLFGFLVVVFVVNKKYKLKNGKMEKCSLQFKKSLLMCVVLV